MSSEKSYPDAPPFPEITAWYRTLHEKWPDVFPKTQLSDMWGQVATQTEAAGHSRTTEAGRALFYHLLKVALLQNVHAAVNKCTACALHEHRLPGRGVFQDGDGEANPLNLPGPHLTPPASATLLILGSHPGPMEGRTALPYSSASVVAGSRCGTRCGRYEGCFPKGAVLPQAPCTPEWLNPTAAAAPGRARAEVPMAIGDPGANSLDRALLEAGEWRASWNPRQRRRTAKPGQAPQEGTVYLTDMVKCPTGGPNPGDPGRPARIEEIRACRIWLEIQLAILQPKAILALGKTAGEQVVNLKEGVGLPFAGPHPRWIARQPQGERPAAQKKLVQAIREARAAADQPVVAEPPLVTEAEPVPEAIDPLAPREATFIPTFPDAATETAVKQEAVKTGSAA